MSKIFVTPALLSLLVLLSFLLLPGCDPERKNACEWYLVPDESRVDKPGKVDEGMIPVCARNYVSNKQDCRLQTKFEFAKKVYGLKFRYTDLKVSSFGNPRTISEIKLCKE